MANTALAVRLMPETVRTLAAAGVLAGYTAVGTAFLNPSRILIIQNLTDQSVMFSFDGVNDHLPLVSNGYIVIDAAANKSNVPVMTCCFAQGTIIYAKRIGTPTTGSVYVSTFYGFNPLGA